MFKRGICFVIDTPFGFTTASITRVKTHFLIWIGTIQMVPIYVPCVRYTAFRHLKTQYPQSAHTKGYTERTSRMQNRWREINLKRVNILGVSCTLRTNVTVVTTVYIYIILYIVDATGIGAHGRLNWWVHIVDRMPAI